MCRFYQYAIAILLAAGGARGWRGLVPLHSNCEDAKRVLGLSDCRSATVDLEDVTLSVAFSDGTCELGWRVPAGSITSLDIHPKNRRAFADLGVDETRYKKMSIHTYQVFFTTTTRMKALASQY